VQLRDGWTPEGKIYYSRFLLPSILNGEAPKQLVAFMAEISNEPQKIKHGAIAEFQQTLGGLVDQWIESGRNNGIEEAWKRNIEWQPADTRRPLVKTLEEYKRRNPPVASIGVDGRFDIWIKPSCLNSSKPLFKAREMALYHFLCLLDSPNRERLSKCDQCGTYFVRARAPKKDMPIFRGSYCENCKGSGGARRTAETRERRKQEQIEWAADAWARWKPTNRYGQRSDWVVRQVNAKRGVSRRIQSNWLTRHNAEIEAEIERRKHAKS